MSILRNFECKKLTDPMIDNLKDENVLRTSIKACKYEISEATTSRDTVIGYLKSNFLMNIPIAILCIFIVIMIIKYNLKLYEKTDEKRPYLYFVGAVYIVFSMLFPNATLLGIIIGTIKTQKNKSNVDHYNPTNPTNIGGWTLYGLEPFYFKKQESTDN